MKIDLDQLILALSDTIDLVGVDEVQHGKRVGYMALACAREMGLEQSEQVDLYHMGLLHDCGVSSTRVHKNLINELEWDGSQQHCEIGAKRLTRFLPLAHFSEPTLYHHTRWPELEDMELLPQSKRDANLIFLLDRVDALVALQPGSCRLAGCDEVVKRVLALRKSFFKEELVDAFIAAAEKEAFWITQEPMHIQEFTHEAPFRESQVALSDAELKAMACLFAEIVDAKSPYTAEHSLGTGRLARYLAQRFSLPEEKVHRIEVAGLLHDLGKLQVPDAVLDLKGKLEGEELAVMRHHSYVTYRILHKIRGLEDVTLWAANHHEKLDGSGYPFHRTAEELGIESRIIMVADIFQALAQNRPYRLARSPQEILEILKQQAAEGKLDADVVGIVDRELSQCYQAAVGEAG